MGQPGKSSEVHDFTTKANCGHQMCSTPTASCLQCVSKIISNILLLYITKLQPSDNL